MPWEAEFTGLTLPMGAVVYGFVVRVDMPTFQLTSFRLVGQAHRPLVGDLRYRVDGQAKPLVIFQHGFKGFKDWGTFNAIADELALAGCVVAKFNGSHNGTTPDQPTHFADLEAFARNTYSIELDDLLHVIEWLTTPGHALPESEIDRSRCVLIGHSRGGGICLLAAAQSARVTCGILWASVADFAQRFTADQYLEWKEKGRILIWNSRTEQHMPLDALLMEDYHRHIDRLEIKRAAEQLLIPVLAIHGTEDETVFIEEAEKLPEWNPRIRLQTIEGANHTFGGSHPWDDDNPLPLHTVQLLEQTLDFIDEGFWDVT